MTPPRCVQISAETYGAARAFVSRPAWCKTQWYPIACGGQLNQRVRCCGIPVHLTAGGRILPFHYSPANSWNRREGAASITIKIFKIFAALTTRVSAMTGQRPRLPKPTVQIQFWHCCRRCDRSGAFWPNPPLRRSKPSEGAGPAATHP